MAKKESHAELKSKVRASKAWKELREVIREKQNNKDFLTEKRLAKKTAAVHHMDLDSANYGDFSDLSHFLFLNSKSHEFLHWAYEEYKNDPAFLDRVKYALDKMCEINHNLSYR